MQRPICQRTVRNVKSPKSRSRLIEFSAQRRDGGQKTEKEVTQPALVGPHCLSISGQPRWFLACNWKAPVFQFHHGVWAACLGHGHSARAVRSKMKRVRTKLKLRLCTEPYPPECRLQAEKVTLSN
jgi:hypothetical protein